MAKSAGWYIALIKHLRNLLITVHGLDFGIPAEMTTFPAFPDLCITMRAGAWEPAKPFSLAASKNLSEGVSNPVAPKNGQKSFQRGDGIKAGIVAAQELDPLATNVFYPPILPPRR